MHRGNCKHCGRPIQPDEDPHYAHVACDEFENSEETWVISPEELAARAERVREYQKRNQSEVKNAKK